MIDSARFLVAFGVVPSLQQGGGRRPGSKSTHGTKSMHHVLWQSGGQRPGGKSTHGIQSMPHHDK